MNWNTPASRVSQAQGSSGRNWTNDPDNFWTDEGFVRGRGDTGWQGRIYDLFDTNFRLYGLNKYLPGGTLGPERVNALFQDQAGAMPYATAPSVGGMQQYGRGAQDMAARAAALQSGQAYQNMGGLNPAARAAAMAQVSQASAGNVGQAGVQGYLQGGQMLQNTGMANLNAQMQERMGQRSSFENALNRGASVGQTAQQGIFNTMLDQMRYRDQQRAQRRAEMMGGVGSVLGGIGSLVGMGFNPMSMLGLGGGGQQMADPYTQLTQNAMYGAGRF